jgi:hypothetical protein
VLAGTRWRTAVGSPHCPSTHPIHFRPTRCPEERYFGFRAPIGYGFHDLENVVDEVTVLAASQVEELGEGRQVSGQCLVVDLLFEIGGHLAGQPVPLEMGCSRQEDTGKSPETQKVGQREPVSDFHVRQG